MAIYILENTVSVNTPGGVISYQAGSLIDEDKLTFPIENFVRVGGRLSLTTYADAAITAEIVRKNRLRGWNPGVDNPPVWRPAIAEIMPESTADGSVLQRNADGSVSVAQLTQPQVLDGAIKKVGPLTVSVAPMRYTVGSTSGLFAGDPALAVIDDAVVYLYLNASGSIVATQAGFPIAAPYVRLGTVTALAGEVTNVSNERTFVTASGLAAGNPVFLAQTEWYIDPVSGDDANTGLSGFPLQTHAEFERRLGHWNTIPASTTINVHILDDLGTGDPINLIATIQGLVTINYIGTATLTSSGTFTDVIALDRATNTPWQLEDTARSADWVDDIGQRIRIVGGPSDGAITWVAKDLGAKLARVSNVAGLAAPPFINVTYAIPVIGDSYVVERLSRVCIGDVTVDAQNSGAGIYSAVTFRDLEVINTAFGGWSAGSGTSTVFIYYGCRFNEAFPFPSSISTIVFYENCGHYSGFVYNGGGMSIFEAGLLIGTFAFIGPGANVTFDGDFMFQGVGPDVQGGSNVQHGFMCVFDAGVGQDAVNVSGGSFRWNTNFFSLLYGDSALYGSGSGGSGINVFGGEYVYQRTPTITGVVGDFRIGNDDMIRAFDNSTGLYTEKRACTWANLDQTVALGGFAGTVVSPARPGAIAKF